MNKSLLFSISAFFVIVIVTIGVIFLAKGYTFNFQEGSVQKTGIMVITSEPRDAAVYLDGKLQNTTNTTLNFLTPGKYNVRVTKDGFTPWEKEVEVKSELVTRLDLTLFSQVPDLRRLTFTGVNGALLTPDGSKIIYQTDDPVKRGLWVMNTTDSLPFVNAAPVHIYQDNGKIDLTKATFLVSPDSKTLLLVDTTKPQQTFYLLQLDRLNENPPAAAQADIQRELVNWYDTLYAKEKDLRERLAKSVADIPPYENPGADVKPILQYIDRVMAEAEIPQLTQAQTLPTQAASPTRAGRATPAPTPQQVSPQDIIAKITYLTQHSKWSPKQNMVVFQQESRTKLYDLTTGKFYNVPQAESVSWFPTNLHLILVNPMGKKGEIAIADYDGQNPVTVFSGEFVGNVVFPWTTGNRIVVLTNLNQAGGTKPNIYAINLR